MMLAFIAKIATTTVDYGEITPRSIIRRSVTVPLPESGLLLISLLSFDLVPLDTPLVTTNKNLNLKSL
jgi:hypothetical protein